MKSIRIGIAGCGRAGKGHLQSFFKAGGKNAWVWDIQQEAAQSLASDFHVQTTSTYEELIHHPLIDAVIIATPNRFHAELAILAMRAGKHVLLEKPMALNERDAYAVIEVAKQNQRILHIGFELRHSSFPLFVKDLIVSGEIGRLYSAHLIHYRGHFWPHWKGEITNGGDMYLMEDCHAIDLFRWWSGDEVETVHAIGTRQNVIRHYEFPDTQFSTFVFRNGFVGHITACHARSAMPDKDAPVKGSLENYTHSQFGHQYEYSLVGEKGSIYFLPLQKVCHIYQHELQRDGAVFQRLSRSVDFPDYSEAIHNGSNQMVLFLKMLQGTLPPIMDPLDALQSHRVCYAARQAQISGLPVNMLASPSFPSLELSCT